jgi:quercetin dioxygenase-like cupin family protein
MSVMNLMNLTSLNSQEKRGATVEIQPKTPSTKGPVEMFTGDVWFDVIARGEGNSRLRVNLVRFSPGARTAWHSHAVGQMLHVVDGLGLVQSRGGEVVEIRPGQTIHTPPDEWHWHGASADHFMAHLAMWEGLDGTDRPESSWGDHVTDEEYGLR